MGSRDRRRRGIGAGLVGVVALVAVGVAAAVFVGSAHANPCVPGAAVDHFEVINYPSSTQAGVDHTFDVRAVGATSPDCTVTDYAGTVNFTATGDAHAVLPTDGQALTGGTGQFTAQFQTVAGGNKTITVTDSADSNITGFQDTIAVTPAPASQFTLTPTDSSPAAGSSFDVAIQALDQFGNVPTDYSDAKTIDWSGPHHSPGPTKTDPSYPSTATNLTFSSSGAATATGIQLFDAESVNLTASDDTTTSISGDAAMVVGPGMLGRFRFSIPSPTAATAGVAFSVTVKAFDLFGNDKTDYQPTPQTKLGNLEYSPGCKTCSPGTVPPPQSTTINPAQPDYGATLTWPSNSATSSSVSVKAFRAGTQTLTVSDPNLPASPPQPVDPDANQVVLNVGVNPGRHPTFTRDKDTSITPNTASFAAQPIDTKTATRIYSFCKPSGATSPPCATTTAASPSTAVQVLVVDDFGNPVPADQAVTMTYIPDNGSATAFVPPVTKTTDDHGIAAFGESLVIGTTSAPALGGYRLQATAGGNPGVSTGFSVVADLTACSGGSCRSKATNNTTKKYSVFGKISTGGDLSGVLLTSQFFATPFNKCTGTYKRVTNQDTEVKTAQGAAPAGTAFVIALIVPKATLQSGGFTSRSVNSFNICVGATTTDPLPVTPWRAKDVNTGILKDAVADSLGSPLYWGWAADCNAIPANQKVPGNPCITTRTKDASVLATALGISAADVAALPFKSGDLAIVLTSALPWDPKPAGP